MFAPTDRQLEAAAQVLMQSGDNGLPLPEVRREEELVSFTWRRVEFDLFVHVEPDGEIFGYYRRRQQDSIDVDRPGEDLHSALDVKSCMRNIGISFMSKLSDSDQD
ncbi:MAG: hypothetical protein ACYDHP_09500 [Ferrimicrobium sp.]